MVATRQESRQDFGYPKYAGTQAPEDWKSKNKRTERKEARKGQVGRPPKARSEDDED